MTDRDALLEKIDDMEAAAWEEGRSEGWKDAVKEFRERLSLMLKPILLIDSLTMKDELYINSIFYGETEFWEGRQK